MTKSKNSHGIGHRLCDLCRICTKRGKPTEMNDLFTTYIEGQFLVHKLEICQQKSIDKNDGLPSSICTDCTSNMIIAYEFYTRCAASEEIFRKVLKDKRDDSGGDISADVAQTITKSKVSEVRNNLDFDETKIKFELDSVIAEKSIHITYNFTNESECGERDVLTDGFIPANDIDHVMYREDEKTATILHESSHAFGAVNGEIENSACCKTDIIRTENLPETGDEIKNKEITLQYDSNAKQRGRIFECFQCKRTFDRVHRLRVHLNLHDGNEKPYECKFCTARFTLVRRLVQHIEKHTRKLLPETENLENGFAKRFKCSECPRDFMKKVSLALHIRQIHKPAETTAPTTTLYQCEYCPKAYNELKNLTRHAKSHDQLKVYQCNRCSKKYSLGIQLADHMLQHAGAKKHICSFCEKGFVKSSSFKDHLRIHTGETPYLCPQCGKTFNNNSNLRQHLNRHTFVKSFTCSECPSRFNSKGSLTSHMRIHTGQRKFVCDTCGSSFTTPYSLAKHKRIHTGDRRYACEMCPMRFYTGDHLKRHMRTHTGEKPYKCKFCDRAFSQSNDLVKHTRSHVGTNTYQCELCPKAFRLKIELRNHSFDHYKKQKINHSADAAAKNASDFDL